MRAVRAEEFGGPEVLRSVLLDPPRPAGGQVVLQVHAVDVLALDIAIRNGEGVDYFDVRPPYVPGDGVSGRVLSVGDGVDSAWIGSVVVATTGLTGGYAEQVVVPAFDLVAVPDGLGLTDAAALVHDGRTAQALIEAAGIAAGQRVLVLPAGSGLGLILVQLARAAGAEVIAAAGSPAKRAAAEAAGAGRLVDYGAPDWSAGLVADGVHVVLDGVGGAVGEQAFEQLLRGGRYVNYGDSGGLAWSPDAERARAREITTFGTEVVHLGSSGAAKRLTERSLADAAAGRIAPVIGERFPLEQAANAHLALESRSIVGRPMIAVSDVER